ncbi:class A beta-lactamase [Paraburkholderia sp. NMBU_R16]|uniref:class A beta-lactamase n=1 Tax=Paraburkholderia sp. NMBU_R16 TaxID=2698676 RepID=UPI0015630C3F|nr:class A beta-lactamase [Paraburkholderia sp. NMBU_R16]NRO95951.1 class A beta-lactamase [Paraburkholderia sp. NMBU_R16]
MQRRQFIGTVASGLIAGLVTVPGAARAADAKSTARAGDDSPNELARSIEARLAAIETRVAGRLGVSILDTDSGFAAGHRENERFPMCSTFKALAAAAVLERVDRQLDDLSRRIVFSREDLVPYSPETGKHAGGTGMTLSELCEAAVTLSDNTAGNLLLASIGGPAGLTAFARHLGDTVTRLDRNEPTLNEALPGDPRDTTSPAAMRATLRTLLLGNRLSPNSRDRWLAWLEANQTGGERIRAGLPTGWRVGDKTGTGERGTANDIAIVWPPGRGPIIVTAYLTATTAAAAQRNAALAEVGRLAASIVG